MNNIKQLQLENERLKQLIKCMQESINQGDFRITCDVDDCNNELCHKYGAIGEKRYCRQHVCEIQTCYKNSTKSSHYCYCWSHECGEYDCNIQPEKGSNFCLNHECNEANCLEKGQHRGYCSLHK
jgi:hypothetical protein